MDFDLVKEPVDERAIKVGPDQVGQFVRDLVCRAGGISAQSALGGRLQRLKQEDTDLEFCGFRA